MGLFSSKKIIDKLSKYFKSNNYEYEDNHGKLSFSLLLKNKNYNLYPYLSIDEQTGYVSIIINIRRIAKKDDNLAMANAFNLKSKYFVLKIKQDIVYLEYNFISSADLIVDQLTDILNSIYSLEEDIDNI